MFEAYTLIGGYGIQLLGTGLLIRQVWRRKSIYGLSLDTQLCHLLATGCRAIWTTDTVLMETKLAYIELIMSFVATLICTVLCYRLRHTRSSKQSPLNGVLNIFTLLPVVFILSVLFHPGPYTWSLQILVSMTMYLEAVSLLPQIALLRKLNDSDTITGNYVAFLAMSRMVRLLFWWYLWKHGEKFWSLLVSDIFHTVLSIDYVRIYFKHLRRGGFGLIIKP